ncbi:hypothetical protein MLD38_003760 [Melastoma candidum]|uniref:Uncharacterized protein n=1 Tax=Melastoma candidum TaxID=119954 RepID=A0ACB9S3H2_9MYRT|nr:hypothetical protein MLD38_003760 [Melastoma candidum]
MHGWALPFDAVYNVEGSTFGVLNPKLLFQVVSRPILTFSNAICGATDSGSQSWHVLQWMRRSCEKSSWKDGRGGILQRQPGRAEGDRQRQRAARCGPSNRRKDGLGHFLLGRASYSFGPVKPAAAAT